MMNLDTYRLRLESRLSTSEDTFVKFRNSLPRRIEHSDWMLLEGLLSSTWQHWGMFCRSVIFQSQLGAITASGTVLQAKSACWEEVSHLSICAAKNKPPSPGKENSVLKREPTWGDTGKLLDIVKALSPGNSKTLSSAFGSSVHIKHVQTVRNASAHRNRDTTKDVLTLAPYYLVSRLRHPAEAMLWLESDSKSPAFLYWIDRMRDVSKLSVI